MRSLTLILLKISSILAFYSTTTCLCNRFDTTVFTPTGTIVGKQMFHDGVPVTAYLGIPFAKPPAGDLRFKKPVPVEPFTKPYKAKNLPPGCVQYTSDPFPERDVPPGLSLDCLYLNIWVPQPASDSNKKTVMFWLFPGGFTIGSSRLDFYDGRVLAAEGDVIVVTTNYRLGAEGFLYAGTDEAPGNMGLFDIVEALNWVRKNIESFGGDKDSITLFGHSSGGIAIGMLTTSPLTRGLFRRAIMLSGTPAKLSGKDNSKDSSISRMLAEAVQCSSENMTLDSHPNIVVGCMRGVDPLEMAYKLSQVTVKSGGYYPRFGDEICPCDPRQAIIDGDFASVDLLIGSANGDGASLLTKSMQDVFGFFGQKDPQINKTFGSNILRGKFESYPDPEAVVRQYLGDVEDDDYNKIRFEVFTAFGDYARNCPTVYFAESFAKKNPNVYQYFITHHASNTPWAPWVLSQHFDIVYFGFGYPLRYPQNYTEEEQNFSRQIIQYWTNFAKLGYPHPDWPQYSKESPLYKILSPKALYPIDIGYGPHRSNCDFFRAEFGF